MAKDKMVEDEVNINPLVISSSFLVILKDSKDVVNISVVKLILTLQSVLTCMLKKC